MTATKRTIAVLLSCALALALAIPSVATALPGGRMLGGLAVAQQSIRTVVSTLGQRLAALEARIAAVLQRRKARFDTASSRMTSRIARVRAIADKVAEAGGDVSSVRSLLDSASQHLGNASGIEAQAVSAFQAVPSASDRRVAFAAARGTGRTAGSELIQARADLRSAIAGLRTVVSGLKASAESSAGAK